ncbi:MAG: PA0069 family radical SAM protein [Verrucomicrobiales bacterium]|nr:PA0069 family radical SAM protein [Verrucomicrobiales bacterium]
MPEFINARGRGTVDSPPNRFEKNAVETDDGALEEIARVDPDFEKSRPATEFLRDETQSIISKNNSPDLGFDASLNPYRGCEHGCAYCYARPYHEFLGFNSGIDFETKIMVKPNAAELLEFELASKRWKPQNLACSGVTDCYQPIEREAKITRACLEVVNRFRNPVGIVTKNALVTRDIDVLQELAAFNCSAVAISLTSLDADLSGTLEPRASRPAGRLQAIRKLTDAGIPAGISLAPVIPGLNDHEIPAILEAAADHGAQFASYTVLRLPYAVKDVFSGWLDRFFPDRKELVLGRVREMRGGRDLNNSEFGLRMRGEGIVADQINQMFKVGAKRAKLDRGRVKLTTEHFRRLQPGQCELDLF